MPRIAADTSPRTLHDQADPGNWLLCKRRVCYWPAGILQTADPLATDHADDFNIRQFG